MLGCGECPGACLRAWELMDWLQMAAKKRHALLQVQGQTPRDKVKGENLKNLQVVSVTGEVSGRVTGEGHSEMRL